MPFDFGGRLKKARMDRGLRQEDVGQTVHVGKSTVSQWENNIHMPDIETVRKIANFLNVSTDYLLCRVDDPQHKIVAKEDLPAELARYVDYIEILKDYSLEDVSPDELREVIEFAKRIKKKP